MWKFFDTLFDRIFSLAGALLFSQVPFFMQQYLQRLGGSVSELKFQVQKLRELASITGKTFPQYIQKFIKSGEPEFIAQGKWLHDLAERQISLQKVYDSLHDASAFTRPFVFIGHLQKDIFWGTLDSFVPGVNLTIEGVAYSLIGLMAGYFFYQGMRKICVITKRYVGNIFKITERKNTAS